MPFLLLSCCPCCPADSAERRFQTVACPWRDTDFSQAGLGGQCPKLALEMMLIYLLGLVWLHRVFDAAGRILAPDQASNLGPQHWEARS